MGRRRHGPAHRDADADRAQRRAAARAAGPVPRRGDVRGERDLLDQAGRPHPAAGGLPRLEELVARGAYSTYGEVPPPYLRPLRHEHLRTLRFESGGLSGTVAQAIGACELPALERLELWLGTEWYGADTTLEDLAPLLDGSRLPALRHLGLENSDLSDQLAAALVSAPVVAQLSTLSLALGTLGDQGAAALLVGQPLTHLAALDLHHHYLSEEMRQRLEDTVGAAGTALDLSQTQNLDDDRPYVANGE